MTCDNCNHPKHLHEHRPVSAFGAGNPLIGSCRADAEQLLYATGVQRCQCRDYRERR